jgi:hypothetical protein
MMPRGTEHQMEEARKILVGDECDPNLPHCDGKKPAWPAKEQTEKCGKLG